MSSRADGRRIRALASIAMGAVLVAACTLGVGSPGAAPTSRPTSASPSIARPSTAAPSRAASTCTSASLEASMDELMAAIGNPDTNAPSEASQAFEDALTSGDPTQVDASAAVVLAHLATAHALIGDGPSGADERLAIACREWDEMIGDIEEATTLMRDGGAAGSGDKVEAGRALKDGALLDHFWQAVKGDDPQMFVEHTRDGRTASASRSRLTTGAGQAFDGNVETSWTTGDALPPQWVQIDIGWPATISGVRLTTFQDVAGPTSHVIAVGGAEGSSRELSRLAGETRDRDVLEYLTPAPVTGVQVLRVTTEQAPGTIGWREIEIMLAPGSSPTACTESDSPITGVTATGGPPAPGTSPDLAIDGDPDTAWDPGPSGMIALDFAEPALVSSVRVWIGDLPPGAPGWTAQLFDGTRWSTLGPVDPSAATKGWLTIPGPAPCVAASGFQLIPQGIEPNPPIREVEVLGSDRAAP